MQCSAVLCYEVLCCAVLFAMVWDHRAHGPFMSNVRATARSRPHAVFCFAPMLATQLLVVLDVRTHASRPTVATQRHATCLLGQSASIQVHLPTQTPTHSPV